MKEITISISNATQRALLAQAHRSNAEQHTDLNLKEWITLLLEETAVAQDVSVAISNRRPEIEAEHNATTERIVTECRNQLLTEIRNEKPAK